MDNTRSGLERVIDAAGGVQKLARAMGISTEAVYSWQRRGFAPTERLAELVQLYGVCPSSIINPKHASVLTLLNNQND